MDRLVTDERYTHRLLLDADGVREAAVAVEAAEAASGKLRAERQEAHRAWLAENRKNALKKGWEPAPEPNPDISFDERSAFQAQLASAKARLEAVVCANAADVTADLQDREREAFAEVREHVAALECLSAEFGLIGKALRTLAVARRGRPLQQVRPSVSDLVYLAGKGEETAVLDFGDGRTNWLAAGARR